MSSSLIEANKHSFISLLSEFVLCARYSANSSETGTRGPCSHEAQILAKDYNCWKNPCTSWDHALSRTFLWSWALGGALLRSWFQGEVEKYWLAGILGGKNGLDAMTPRHTEPRWGTWETSSKAREPFLMETSFPGAWLPLTSHAGILTRGLSQRAYLPEFKFWNLSLLVSIMSFTLSSDTGQSKAGTSAQRKNATADRVRGGSGAESGVFHLHQGFL